MSKVQPKLKYGGVAVGAGASTPTLAYVSVGQGGDVVWPEAGRRLDSAKGLNAHLGPFNLKFRRRSVRLTLPAAPGQ